MFKFWDYDYIKTFKIIYHKYTQVFFTLPFIPYCRNDNGSSHGNAWYTECYRRSRKYWCDAIRWLTNTELNFKFVLARPTGTFKIKRSVKLISVCVWYPTNVSSQLTPQFSTQSDQSDQRSRNLVRTRTLEPTSLVGFLCHASPLCRCLSRIVVPR